MPPRFLPRLTSTSTPRILNRSFPRSKPYPKPFHPLSTTSTTRSTADMPPGAPPNTPAGPATPSTPRHSSSLLLLDHQNRILLVQRSHEKSMSFSSAIVFPGGNLDPTHDSFLLHKSTSLPAALPQDQFDLSPELVTALKTCAIRETFEETGVLLADPRTPDQPPPTESDLSKARSLLLGTKSATPPTTFSQILASLNLSLPLSSLYPFTTWITPLPSPKRYYTAMFLAFLPPHLTPTTTLPHNHGDEILQSRWIYPRDLLRSYHAQSHSPPTPPQPHSPPIPPQTAPPQKLILFPPQLYLLTTLTSFLRTSNPSTSSTPTLLSLSASSFGKYVIQPYTKRVLDGGENGKILLGIDKPRGDKTVWVKARFGKAGPREVEVLERESWKGEGARGKWRNGEKGREEGAGAGAKL